MQGLSDFLVIGAARAGTTALHSFLRQHPEIFMPATKEPNFFAYENQKLNCEGPGADYINNSVTSLSEYKSLFSSASRDQRCGDASPLYLYSADAPVNIHRHKPDMRMIVILRNPIDQAFSHYLYAVKQCIETETDFHKALFLEDERLAANWQPLFGYSSFPKYCEQLERYFQLFPRSQFLIRTYEDFQSEPENLMRDIYEFLDVDVNFQTNMSGKLNAGGVPKNQAFQNFLMKSNPLTRAIGFVVPQETRIKIRDKLAKFNMSKDDEMPTKALQLLHQRLDPEIKRLGQLIDLDLSHWTA